MRFDEIFNDPSQKVLLVPLVVHTKNDRSLAIIGRRRNFRPIEILNVPRCFVIDGREGINLVITVNI